jgi:hypothetical protein
MAMDTRMTWQFILGKQLLNAALNITPTHGTVLQRKGKWKVLDTYCPWIISFFHHSCFLTYTEDKLLWHSSSQQAGNANRLWAKDLEIEGR